MAQKQSNYQISIPIPCSESWAKMDQTDGGRYCHNCRKNVVDFTQKSDTEINRLLQQNEGNLCGRFHFDQLERDLIVTPNKPKRTIGILFSGLLTLFTTQQIISQNKQTTLNSQTVITPDDKKQPPENTAVNDSTWIIDGIVLDESSLPLPAASITIANHPKMYQADLDGNFKIVIPDSQNLIKLNVEIALVGYETRHLEISKTDLSAKYTIEMKESKAFIGEIVIEKRNLWTRFKSIFRRQS